MRIEMTIESALYAADVEDSLIITNYNMEKKKKKKGT